MARVKYVGTVTEWEKEFLRLFNQLTYSRSAWQVWEDLMTVMACSICNAVDRRKEPFERREKQYERAIKDLGNVDIPAQIFGIIVRALDENPNQDFLGRIYMNLNLGSHWHGQFFTPYHICELMAKLQIGEECQSEIEKKGVHIRLRSMCWSWSDVDSGGSRIPGVQGELSNQRIVCRTGCGSRGCKDGLYPDFATRMPWICHDWK